MNLIEYKEKYILCAVREFVYTKNVIINFKNNEEMDIFEKLIRLSNIPNKNIYLNKLFNTIKISNGEIETYNYEFSDIRSITFNEFFNEIYSNVMQKIDVKIKRKNEIKGNINFLSAYKKENRESKEDNYQVTLPKYGDNYIEVNENGKNTRFICNFSCTFQELKTENTIYKFTYNDNTYLYNLIIEDEDGLTSVFSLFDINNLNSIIRDYYYRYNKSTNFKLKIKNNKTTATIYEQDFSIKVTNNESIISDFAEINANDIENKRYNIYIYLEQENGISKQDEYKINCDTLVNGYDELEEYINSKDFYDIKGSIRIVDKYFDLEIYSSSLDVITNKLVKNKIIYLGNSKFKK